VEPDAASEPAATEAAATEFYSALGW